ncbi:MAG TPA: thiosulfate oxidation carrier protein SoxY [Burkholderiaceae bacterium]|nr:thiosulfate oxidation carrier protein SoxY [Burkholderiaceae bacterium]
MNQQRRSVLKVGTVMALAVSAGILKPEQAWAIQQEWDEKAFAATDVDGVVKALGGDSATESDQITLIAPDIAENGAVVPVGVNSALPNTTEIAIMVPDNPSTLTAFFKIPEDGIPEVATRIKMGQTSDVYGLVKADGKYYMVHKEVKVTLGGCGG